MQSALVLLATLLLDGAAAFWQPACCATRLPASRVAVARTATCMCDAAVEEPAADAAADAAPVAEAPRPKKKAKTPIAELEVGAEVTGKIRSVMAYGAFVDIGASTDGLLHVSEISNDFVKDANEKLTAGEEVTCKIKSINLEKNQLALSCKDDAPRAERSPRKPKADLTEYESADPKEFVTGTVNSITDYGAFITLKEGVDGLCHISSIQEGGVGKVSDVLTIGQEVKVRVVSFDKSKRRIGLSMKEYVEGESAGRAPRRSRDDDFDSNDDAFKMNEEELEALTVEDEGMASSFEAAFSRAASIQATKAEGKKYKAQVL